MNQGKNIPSNSSNNQNSSSGSETKKKESSSSHTIEQNKYRNNIEEVKTRNLNNPEMLLASINNIIHPEDSIIYFPKSIHLLYNKYPVYPLRLKEEMLKNFDIDTLFFMFFEQDNLCVKEMARKEIIKRGWMFNNSYETFFRLKGEPKKRTEKYIEGEFELFDHEKEWKKVGLNDFKFEFPPKEQNK